MLSRATVVFLVMVGLAWPVDHGGSTLLAGEPAQAPLGVKPQAATPEALDLSQLAQVVMGPASALMSDAGSLPKFEDVTKDMKSHAGLFTLWYYPSSAADKDQEKLLCQIPAAMLGKQFMLSTSFSGGGFFTGFPLEERVVRWELLDKQLLLIEPEWRYVVDPGKEVSDAVTRTYPGRIRAAIPLVTKSPAGDPVIDLGPLLKSNFADIGWMMFDPMNPFASLMGGPNINPSLSKWTKKKTFELNVEIGVELAVGRSSPPGSYDKKQVHFSFWKLPDSDYQPRRADPRVGYFLTANQDWAKGAGERTLFNRYINRWHLVKRDPSLTLCEPKQPIIYYIEKTVPVKYRRAVRDGILEWNKAFEKVGFVNAVEVRQQTDDNEWKDLDPEDMRYSFFRWIVTGGGFAMGPSRVNPFTGEIHDADIIFDDSMVRFFQREAEIMLPSALLEAKFSDPALRAFVERHPLWQRPLPEWELTMHGDTDDRARQQALRHRARERGWPCCEYSDGMKHQMRLAHTMMAEVPEEVRERFLYDVIKEVVMHEVGHTLGLRHNFKASTIYGLDEVKQRRLTGDALVGSVMDYNPVLFWQERPMEGHFLTPTIGPYDFWAIEYGYRPFDPAYAQSKQAEDKSKREEQKEEEAKPIAAKPAPDGNPPAPQITSIEDIDLSQIPPEMLAQLPSEVKQMIESGDISQLMSAAAASGGMPATPQVTVQGPKFAAPPAGEAAMLETIAGRSTEPELAYATDEDTTFIGADPTSNRFDMGADPVDWAKARIALVDQRLDNILEWAVRERESWEYLRPSFLTLWAEKAFVLDYVGRYVGGQYFSRAHRGEKDAPAPLVLVEPKRQREALSFIEETLYRDDYLGLSPEVLTHLVPARWYHDGAMIAISHDFPVHDYIAMFQWWNLFDRLYPDTLRRIHDAELKTNAKDKLTVAEYLQRVQEACWGEATDLSRLQGRQWTDNQPFLSDVRRSLQREYLNLVEPLVRQRPGMVLSPDLHAMVEYSVRQLGAELENVQKANKADFASQAHLAACTSRINRMLSAELREFEAYGSSGMMFGRPTGQAQPRP